MPVAEIRHFHRERESKDSKLSTDDGLDLWAANLG